MFRRGSKFFLQLARATIALIFFTATSGAFAQMIDFNGNGMSDIWEWIYSATNLDPNADPDGDGFSNQQEATAGTNPFDSNSYPKISLLVMSGTNGNISMPAQLGKFYQLQSASDISGTNWLVETGMVMRAGTNLTFQSPADSATKFYRIAISDTNSDGSGLMNDWEKYQLGLDPSNAFSNATLDGNGNADVRLSICDRNARAAKCRHDCGDGPGHDAARSRTIADGPGRVHRFTRRLSAQFQSP